MSQYSNALQNMQTNALLLQQLKQQNALTAAQAQFHQAAAQQVPVSHGTWVNFSSVKAHPSVTVAPKLPSLPVSTKFGEIIAHRFWNYYRGYLKSASQEYVWMPGQIAGLQEGQKLDDYGSAGIHAFKSQSDMVIQCYSGDLVFGTVKLWGDVIEYERGYHAEFASIVSLDHIDLPDDRSFQREALTELRERYLIQKEK